MNESMIARTSIASVLSLVYFLTSCGTESDRVSDVHTLRVLAVRAETPFAKPGSTTQLSMLAFDGSPRAKRADGSTRATSTLWIGGCSNPPGDNFAACMPYLHEVVEQLSDEALAQQAVPADAPSGIIGWGQTFEAHLATDIITSRAIAAGVVNPYGVQMVFFAHCGGTLRRVSADASSFPIACFDSQTGEELGRDDFEFGFYPVFAYDSIENQNPTIEALTYDGSQVGADCLDTAPCPADYHCGSENRCLPVVARCTASDADQCEKHPLAAVVPQSSVERDVVARFSAAEAQPETIWVSFYANGGSFDHAAQMINQPSTGWNGNPSGSWRANTDANREVRLWAIVRDSRNGVAWSWVDVWVGS